jgi:hypothetical protein
MGLPGLAVDRRSLRIVTWRSEWAKSRQCRIPERKRRQLGTTNSRVCLRYPLSLRGLTQMVFYIGNPSSTVSLSVKHHNWFFGGHKCTGRIDITIDTRDRGTSKTSSYSFIDSWTCLPVTILEVKSSVGNDESRLGNITVKPSCLAEPSRILNFKDTGRANLGSARHSDLSATAN